MSETFIGGAVRREFESEALAAEEGCLGRTAVRRRTRDRKVAGSTPGRGAVQSTR